MFLTPGSVVGGGAPSSELPLLFCHCNFEGKMIFCQTLFSYCTAIYCNSSCGATVEPTCHIEEAVVGLGLQPVPGLRAGDIPEEGDHDEEDGDDGGDGGGGGNVPGVYPGQSVGPGVDPG